MRKGPACRCRARSSRASRPRGRARRTDVWPAGFVRRGGRRRSHRRARICRSAVHRGDRARGTRHRTRHVEPAHRRDMPDAVDCLSPAGLRGATYLTWGPPQPGCLHFIVPRDTNPDGQTHLAALVVELGRRLMGHPSREENPRGRRWTHAGRKTVRAVRRPMDGRRRRRARGAAATVAGPQGERSGWMGPLALRRACDPVSTAGGIGRTPGFGTRRTSCSLACRSSPA